MEEKQDYLSSVFESQESLLSYKMSCINSFASSKTFISCLNDSSDNTGISEFSMKDFLLPIYQTSTLARKISINTQKQKIKHSCTQKQHLKQSRQRKKINMKRFTEEPTKKYRFLKMVKNQNSKHPLLFEQFVMDSSEINGKGYLFLQDGRIIQGQFNCGLPLGQLRIKSPNGLIYNGAVYEFRPHGFGQMRLPNGDRFEGEFSYGQPHGQGTHYAKNGQIKKQGEWRHGKFIN